MAPGENTIVQKIHDKVKTPLDGPLCLIAVHFMNVDFEGEVKDGSEVWLKDITLDVPLQTEFACATVAGVDVSFGATGEFDPRSLGRLYYSLNEVKPEDVTDGKFTFTLSACLQDDKFPHKWSARFALQIFCYGKC
jgi:hypothetical protein